MKLKYLLFNYILIGLFCACTLTACGSDDPAPAPTPPEKPEQPEPEEPEYEGILTNKLIDAYYMGVGITGTAEYYIVFSNVETDDTYMPKEKGITVILDMFSTPSADAINPILPTGTYNYNENKDINTFNPQNSYILIKGDEGDAQMGVISNGTVTVAYESGIYTITADLEIMGQTTVSCRYQGAIQFIEGASNSFDRITKDLNLTFEKAEGRYFANQAYHHSDDFSLYLTTGDIDSSGEGTDGYFLLFQGYTFKIDPSSSINILDGTYIAYPYVSSV